MSAQGPRGIGPDFRTSAPRLCRPLGCPQRQPEGPRDDVGRPTHLPTAPAVVLPADDGEGGFARGAEAAGLVRDPLGRVYDNDRGGHVSQRDPCGGGSGDR